MALAKIEGATPEEIKTIKDNPSELIKLNWDPEPVINLLDPEQFYKYYQELALTKKEQEQHSSSIQNGNNNNNNSNSDSNSDSNYEQYIALFDLTKEQELKWFSNNDKDIMPECTHDTDAGFDLRYLGKDSIKLEPHSHTCINNDKDIMPECTHDTDAEFDLRYLGKNSIKLEPHSHTCINLKIALEIPATTMVQLASRSSLAKRELTLEEE
ncbi:hypothetical protein G9A89_023077 [Geosiphon pyriformis]|nr:hypothetical protein G9A89_023077 [Geosiphon pyriformis]